MHIRRKDCSLFSREQKLPATSHLMPDLEMEIPAVWDLVRSYRMVQGRQHLRGRA
jgi:hypothetical protein